MIIEPEHMDWVVEKVARAICASNGVDPDTDVKPGDLYQPEWQFYTEDATAAINAYLSCAAKLMDWGLAG